MERYDFSGWATRSNIRCSDGRTIMKDAFKECYGKTVPLCFGHNHDDPNRVLGHAILENRGGDVYTYGVFNDTESGRTAKELVRNGDIVALSIYANDLQHDGANVTHGVIREVSLVLAGANPGAFIDTVLAHSEDGDDKAVIYTGEPIELYHANNQKEERNVAKERTVQDVVDSMTEEQKTVLYALVGAAAADDTAEEEENEVKHNIFENDAENTQNVLSHDAMKRILADAKRCGSLREAVDNAVESGVLMHSIDTTGMTTATGTQTYGFNDPSMLFPDYKNLNNPPEWISREMGWVRKVMAQVHHTPFSRIKSTYANITEDDARARGYIKGKQKKHEVFATLKRTTDPQTVYKLQKMDRDDVIDIVDFDVVAWIKAEMRTMLDEELARAFLIGDGRLASSDDKISADHIRPIATDVPLFNTQVVVSAASTDSEQDIAKKTINAAIRARKNYKGSGTPTFWTTEDVLTEMLLIEDGIGHKLYKTEQELATALRVKEIVTVEPMEGVTLTVNSKNCKLIGIIVNLVDYNVGADKGGAVNMFDDFDLDYNQEKYLIETRCSGALIKPYSALTLVLDQATSSTSDDDETQG